MLPNENNVVHISEIVHLAGHLHYTSCFSFGDDTIGLIATDLLSGSQQIEFYNFNLEMNLVMDRTCLENDDLENNEIGVMLF